MTATNSAPRRSSDTVGDDRVVAATGRTREEWFGLLDRAGAQDWDHGHIARWLGGKHDVDGWWAQSVTVAYEQARGLREPGQRSDGTFTASATKTVRAPRVEVWPHLAEDDLRRDWLDVELKVRGMTENKSVRLSAEDGSRVTILLSDLKPGRDGAAKCRVAVEHDGLRDGDELAQTKEFWRAVLSELADLAGD